METNNEFFLQDTELESSNLEKGKFDYILNATNKKMLMNAWEAITQLDLWDFIKDDVSNFIFSGDKRVHAISDKMFELGYRDHSGFSFAWIMRQMQYIALHGEENYKKYYFK
jgi:hypothetical protein